MARATSRCAKKNDASIPLHTLQALRALARIKVPGGVRFLFFFFWVRKKEILKPLYPFFSKKSVQGVQGVQYLFYHPLRPAIYTPPFTSSLYQLPPEALVLLFSS